MDGGVCIGLEQTSSQQLEGTILLSSICNGSVDGNHFGRSQAPGTILLLIYGGDTGAGSDTTLFPRCLPEHHSAHEKSGGLN